MRNCMDKIIFFSESNISIESPISMETQSSNPLKDEIEYCLEQNLAGGSSIASENI